MSITKTFEAHAKSVKNCTSESTQSFQQKCGLRHIDDTNSCSTVIKLVIPNPTAKSRHRMALRGKKVISYDIQHAEKEKAKTLSMQQMRENGLKPISDGQITAYMRFYLPIPKSLSRKRKIEFLGKPHTKKPDIDNYMKFYMDALTGVAYEDDKLIYSVEARKEYSDRPRVEIELKGV